MLADNEETNVPATEREYRCNGCGETVDREDAVVGWHVVPDHAPDCWGDCRGRCPVPVQCGPVPGWPR